MSHRHHLLCVFAAVGLALWFVFAGSGGSALAGVSLAILLCPLVMGFVMWLLMRGPKPTTDHEVHRDQLRLPADHATTGQR